MRYIISNGVVLSFAAGHPVSNSYIRWWGVLAAMPAHMNLLCVGTADFTQQFLDTKQPFLLLSEGTIGHTFEQRFPDAKVFDLSRHRFNPLQGMNHRRARALARAVYSFEEDSGKTTLTVRNGKRAFTSLAMTYDYLKSFEGNTKDPAIAEALAMRDDIVLSPDLNRIFGHTPNFPITGSIILPLDSPQLDDFDVYVLATTMILRFQGQIIVPDLGRYGRDFYMSFIRHNRLMAGVRFLSELPPKLRTAVLQIDSKIALGTTHDDAETLAKYARISPNINRHSDFVDEAMT